MKRYEIEKKNAIVIDCRTSPVLNSFSGCNTNTLALKPRDSVNPSKMYTCKMIIHPHKEGTATIIAKF